MTNSQIDELREQVAQIGFMDLANPGQAYRAFWILADTLEAILQHLKTE